jgi:hypothetical protein
MSATPLPNALLVAAADPGLYAHLQRLASAQRCVFFAGLPGTGKSLLSHQLTHLAHTMGRTVHMLQWDVARPVFEASAAGQHYPVVHGVTHGVIRKAASLWARQAVVQWHQRYPEAGHLLIGETPFVGHRFIELARQRADAAEPLLRMACFVVPVPSRTVRDFLEAERQRRSVRPLHVQEREDAPPQVLRDLWAIWLALPQRSALARSLRLQSRYLIWCYRPSHRLLTAPGADLTYGHHPAHHDFVDLRFCRATI